MVQLFAEAHQEYLTDDGREAIQIRCSNGEVFSILKPEEYDFSLPEDQTAYLDRQCNLYYNQQRQPGRNHGDCAALLNLETGRIELRCDDNGHGGGHGLKDLPRGGGGRHKGGGGFDLN